MCIVWSQLSQYTLNYDPNCLSMWIVWSQLSLYTLNYDPNCLSMCIVWCQLILMRSCMQYDMESSSWCHFSNIRDTTDLTAHFVVQTATKSFADSGKLSEFVGYQKQRRDSAMWIISPHLSQFILSYSVSEWLSEWLIGDFDLNCNWNGHINQFWLTVTLIHIWTFGALQLRWDIHDWTYSH